MGFSSKKGENNDVFAFFKLTAPFSHVTIFRMPTKRKKKPLLHSTELSAHIKMEGDLITDNSLLIKGGYSGSIASSSHITIDKEAIVESCGLTVKSLSISGRFSGEIKAETFVEICGKARVSAIIDTPDISIAETSHFEGRIRMPGIGD